MSARHLLHIVALFLSLSTLRSIPSFAAAQEINSGLEDLVKQRLFDSAWYSWELGLLLQVILEYQTPSLSVFTPNSIPPQLSTVSNQDLLQPLRNYTQIHLDWLKEANGGAVPKDTTQALWLNDGSAGDPASFAPPLLLMHSIGWGDESYLDAATNQLLTLEQATPRSDDGAISHRAGEAQLWADNCYMVPPFLAYYGTVRQNITLVQEAVNQLRLYREHLRDPNASNLWRHIVLGGNEVPQDYGYWATGNGWAALGITRTIATIKHSQYADQMQNEMNEMAGWVEEVFSGMVQALDNSTYIFNNYLTIPPSTGEGNFADAASTALFAYSVYRLSVLMDIHTYIPEAEAIRKALSAKNEDGSGSGYTHFDAEGYLLPVVNPRSYGVQGEKSPEGQAFVLGMQVAYREWIAKGSPWPTDRSDDAAAKGDVGAIQLTGMAMVFMASQFMMP